MVPLFTRAYWKYVKSEVILHKQITFNEATTLHNVLYKRRQADYHKTGVAL
jgi:hypothetical protein